MYLGKNDDEVNEIDDFILASFFKLDLKLNVASIELFANNVLLFINNEAKKIFVSDTKVLDELNKFCIMRNKDYTMKLLKIQNLAKLDKAWVSRDDVIFIKTVNSMNLNELPKSYKLKYKIVFNRSMNNP